MSSICGALRSNGSLISGRRGTSTARRRPMRSSCSPSAGACVHRFSAPFDSSVAPVPAGTAMWKPYIGVENDGAAASAMVLTAPAFQMTPHHWSSTSRSRNTYVLWPGLYASHVCGLAERSLSRDCSTARRVGSSMAPRQAAGATAAGAITDCGGCRVPQPEKTDPTIAAPATAVTVRVSRMPLTLFEA